MPNPTASNTVHTRQCRRARVALILIALSALAAIVLAAPNSSLTAEQKKPVQAVDFHRDIKPIFVKHCFACHGPAKSESGLRLDLRSSFFKGGDDGPIVVKGD